MRYSLTASFSTLQSSRAYDAVDGATQMHQLLCSSLPSSLRFLSRSSAPPSVSSDATASNGAEGEWAAGALPRREEPRSTMALGNNAAETPITSAGHSISHTLSRPLRPRRLVYAVGRPMGAAISPDIGHTACTQHRHSTTPHTQHMTWPSGAHQSTTGRKQRTPQRQRSAVIPEPSNPPSYAKEKTAVPGCRALTAGRATTTRRRTTTWTTAPRTSL